MGWWVSETAYARNDDDLRLLAELIRIHVGRIVGQQTYVVVENNHGKTKNPYTIDRDERPRLVAIYIALLDPEHAPSLYPKSKDIAIEIAERKTPMRELEEASQHLVMMLNVNTQAWYRAKRQSSRSIIDARARLRIKLFAETLTRAAQIYKQTLERNRILWDTTCQGYIGDICARNFNFAFSVHYVKLAVKELQSRHINLARQDDNQDDGLDFGDVPDLVYDEPPSTELGGKLGKSIH
jgi:hypothetical protein